jgi:hypothetical protein
MRNSRLIPPAAFRRRRGSEHGQSCCRRN